MQNDASDRFAVAFVSKRGTTYGWRYDTKPEEPMKKLQALWAYATSAKGKSQFHALVTSALAVYTALKSAGI